jgi:hypothetical protein
MTDSIHKRITSEMIGRTAFVAMKPDTSRVNIDLTKVDYAFWAKFRRGKARGYEIGGLFAAPIARILISWVLGDGFGVRIKADGVTDDQIAIIEETVSGFVQDNLLEISETYYDSISLGDGYLVVNPDATLSQVPADMMTKEPDPLDYRKVNSYTITTVTDTATIQDIYRLDGRTVKVKQKGQESETVTEYGNVIGRLPVIHIANNREANEIYGHPIYEALLPLLGHYDDTTVKSLEGVKLMGNPKPVMEGAEDPESEIERLSNGKTTNVVSSTGESETVPVIDFDSLPMLVLGKGASFSFKSPSQFTGDAAKMLELLFLLMLQHSMIPEWVWGGAIASSKASVDSQMPAFARYISGLRSRLAKMLIELIRIWIGYKNMLMPLYSGAIDDLKISIEWPEIEAENEQIKQAWVQMLYDRSLITDATTVNLSGLVKDAQSEVEAARNEADNKKDVFDQYLNSQLNQPDDIEAA